MVERGQKRGRIDREIESRREVVEGRHWKNTNTGIKVTTNQIFIHQNCLFQFTIVLLRMKRRALKRRDALWRLFACDKLRDSRYFLFSYVDFVMVVGKEIMLFGQ